jgi:hypothetical protein
MWADSIPTTETVPKKGRKSSPLGSTVRSPETSTSFVPAAV